jgi:hypothetical protein
MLRATCKNPDCGKTFLAERAGAQYCSLRCRVAAYRKRHQLPPVVKWYGKQPRLGKIARSFHSDGTLALSNEELGERLLELAEEGDGGKPKTARRFFYLALSHGYIQPDMGASDQAKKSRDAAYDRIVKVLGVLRKQGKLGWHDVLDLTRELVEWQVYSSAREARAHMRRVYNEDRWLGQEYFPVFIVEKDTMVPVCQPMAGRWQMPFASSRGYGSLTLQHDIAKMLRRRHAKTGQQAMIYFASDFDPSGLDLQRSWEEALDDFVVIREPFERIALTLEQVTDADLDLDRFAIEVKPSDSRAETFIAQYGDRCWEADVLSEAVIQAALDSHIESWLDEKKWNRRAKEIEKARRLL